MQLQQALTSFSGSLLSLKQHAQQALMSTATGAAPGSTAGADAPLSDSALALLTSMRQTVSSVARELVTDLRSSASGVLGSQHAQLQDAPAPAPLHAAAALLLPEVMLHVFSFMSLEDALLAGPVCKVWHETAKSPMLWTGKVCPALATACHCRMFDPTMRNQRPHPLPTTPRVSSASASPHPEVQPVAEHDLEGSTADPNSLVPTEGLGHLGRPLALPQVWLAFHHRNFLRNPDFQRLLNSNLSRPSWKSWRRNAWVFPTTGGDGISWECPPVCCAPVPAAPKLFPAGLGASGMAARAQQQLQGLLVGAEHGGCIATSSDWNEVMQVVDFVEELTRRGLSRQQAEHVLDSGLPLGFSIYVGAHSEAGGQFSACMFLLEKEPEDVLNIAQRFVAKPSRYHFYSGKLKTTSPGQWQRFAHVVEAAPRGFRYGIVLLRAKDQASSKGHFGAKLACAQLSFLPQSEKALFGKGDDQAAWVQCMVDAGLVAGPGAGAGAGPAAAAVAAVAALVQPVAQVAAPLQAVVLPAQPVVVAA